MHITIPKHILSQKVHDKTKNRFWELDFLKGLAIVGVILYHLMFDLVYFAGMAINLQAVVWDILAILSAGTFIFVSGISASISYYKHRETADPLGVAALRSLKLLGLALCISLSTYIMAPNEMIYFGILHFLAVAGIIAYFLMRSLYAIIATALAVVLAMPYIEHSYVSHYYLLWLGIKPYNFATLDYFPLIPWLAIFCIGMAIGVMLYPQGTSRVQFAHSNSRLVRSCAYLGKHTLLLYMVHQPILLGIIFLRQFIMGA